MVKVNREKCIGCGVCVSVCPEGFEIVGGKSRVKNENAKCIAEAAAKCPMKAILLDENEEKGPSQPQQQPQQKPSQLPLERGMGKGLGRGAGMGMGRGRGRGMRRRGGRF